MIRTVWLALICLISLGALAAIKVGTASLANAEASRGETPAGTNVEQDTLAKSDKLEVSNIEPLPSKKMVMPVAIMPPQITSKPTEPITKIVSRHWHDPLVPKAEPVANRPKVNHRRRPQRDSRARGCTAHRAYRKCLVPELTGSADIKLNERLSLWPAGAALLSSLSQLRRAVWLRRLSDASQSRFTLLKNHHRLGWLSPGLLPDETILVLGEPFFSSCRND